jgi:hypothetical protein
MDRSHGTWGAYTGSSAIILGIGLLVVTGVLLYLAMRFRRPISLKRPGRLLKVVLVMLWFFSIVAWLAAFSIYVIVLLRQQPHYVGASDPITPVTLASALIAFFTIIALAQRHGARIAIGAAIVGTIAAPMIFELPFDLIVMWHTYPPQPALPFTFLFFGPLFLIELLSFTLLTFSSLTRLSRVTLFCLAAMFLVFTIWAFFGFAYPYDPLPTALNMISKVIAFATAVSLFLPEKAKGAEEVAPVRTGQGNSSEKAETSDMFTKLEPLRDSTRGML